MELYQIFCASFMVDQVQVDEGWSVSTTPELKTFSVGQMSNSAYFSWDIFSYISPSSAYCKGSNSWMILGILRDHKFGSNFLSFLTAVIPTFLSVCPVMNNMLYLFWSIVISQSCLCIFSKFSYADVVLFSMKLIQKASTF